MVLPLVDYCLIATRDIIERGQILNLHLLPPILRQSLLDMVLMHGTINNPNCLSALSSVDFLRGLNSLNTQCGNIYDNRYLKHVLKSMRSIDSNGRTIGSSIEELRLRFHCYKGSYGLGIKSNYRSVIRLIKECTSLKILHLDMRKPKKGGADFESDDDLEREEDDIETLDIFNKAALGGLLNNCLATDPCLSVMENLDELSLKGFSVGAPILAAGYAIIKFKNLSKLSLSDCNVDSVAWRYFLKSIRNTLIALDVDSLEILSKVNEVRNNILLVSLPRLKSLKAKTCRGCINKLFLENLTDCKALDYVRLDLGVRNEEADLAALNRMNNFRLDINVNLVLSEGQFDLNDVFDSESKFKLINIFKDKVRKFSLSVQYLNSSFATALDHLVDVCPNLTRLSLGEIDFEQGVDRRQESEKIYSTLTRLFNDENRASKFRDLIVDGDYDPNVLAISFRNCVNVERLTITNSRNLGNDHLIDLALRGGRPSEICLINCSNIGDDGLVPILISSGGRLKRLEISTSVADNEDELVNVTERTWRALAYHCRNVESVYGIPERFCYLLEEKCFNKSVIYR